MPHRVDVADSADGAGLHELLERLEIDLARSAAAGRSAGSGRWPAPPSPSAGASSRSAAHGLLAVDVLAGVHGVDRDGPCASGRAMPISTASTSVSASSLRWSPKFRASGRLLSSGIAARRRRHRRAPRTSTSGILLEQAHHIGAALARPDHAQTDPVVRPEDPGIREGRRRRPAHRLPTCNHQRSYLQDLISIFHAELGTTPKLGIA